MKTYPVTISSRDPDTAELQIIMGLRFQDIKELAWHPTVEKLLSKGKEYTVTHIPTGLVIAFFNKLHKARRFTIAIRKYDWDFTKKDFENYTKNEKRGLLDWINKIKGGLGDGEKKISSHTRQMFQV